MTFKHLKQGGRVQDSRDYELVKSLFDELRNKAWDGVGITRESYGVGESTALDVIEAKSRFLGLPVERDAAANLVVTMEGSEPSLPFLACGSHLDSVPQGGNYDGAAGVVAGLAVLAGFVSEGYRPRRTVKLYGLRGEESARFGKAYVGSLALLGRLSREDLSSKEMNGQRTLAECMSSVGVDVERVFRAEPLLNVQDIAAWLELHIEQGPVLAARDLPIGIVTGIRGNIRHRSVVCTGTPGHSGAVPRWLRRDALFATAELITHLDRHWRTLLERGRDVVFTSGMFGTDPGEHAIARIPGKVCFSIDIRSQYKDTLEACYDLFRSECDLIAEDRSVNFDFDRRIDTDPATMDLQWIARLKAVANSIGLPAEELPSGAGHDAAVFANAGVPSAMIFVRNENGSHNPNESMDIEDLLAGIALMRGAIKDASR